MRSKMSALRKFDDLARLGDHEVQQILKETDGCDLTVALKEADEAVKAKVFKNISSRAAAMIREDIDYLGPVKPKQVAAARAKMLKIARCLQKTGWKAKPRPPRVPSEFAARLLENLAEKPVGSRTAAEMVPLLKGMAELAKRDGILELEAVLEALKDDFTLLGFQLAVDGTDPALIKELLELRKKAILAEQARKLEVISTGIVAIQHGTNPRLVEVMCRACLP